MNVLLDKLKEVLYSVLPITIIVLIMNFTIVPLEASMILRFILGALLIVIGLTIFLFGVDIGISPMGNLVGASLAKANKIWIIIVGALTLGFFVSVAEPDLHILASQVADVTSGMISKTLIVVVVSIGIAVLLALGLIRIVYNVPLYLLLFVLYLLIFVLAIFTSPEFLAIAFDSSGATTGALTVPFILALAIGVSSMKKDSKASEKDSFGLVAIASVGAILSVLIMSIILKTDKITGTLETSAYHTDSIFGPFIKALPIITLESVIALLPLLILFLIFHKFSLKLHRRPFIRIVTGFVLTFVGLTLFLVGVNAGFMDVGSYVGLKVGILNIKPLTIGIGFLFGLLVILAEPAVYVLTHQIEDVTSGYVNRKVVMFALSIGVGLAVALSMVRILIPGVKLWHYLLPGYIIAVALTFFAPKLFVGMAFDSGGVASGPMTATFILAFAQGVAEATEEADVLIDGFGMISMVAMMPIIALQILGLLFKLKSRKGGITNDG